MNQREMFVRQFLHKAESMSELCRRYGVSRKTGYKWVDRFYNGGLPALLDKSRTPMSHPNQVPSEICDAIVALRKERPTWGARKLLERLRRDHPATDWPSESAAKRILKRRGLTTDLRKRRKRTPASELPLAAAYHPNDVWCTDFKGKFRIARKYCHPLTVSDACSRYVLCCRGFDGELLEPTQQAFERAFKEFGLPWRMRSDNGTPFASTSVGGLSRLSIWWIKLGITPERIRPGSPQQNGQHERMHRTLKQEAVGTTATTAEEQQQLLDAWRDDFNMNRPHEALDMATPNERYRKSERQFPEEVGDPEYPDAFDLARVSVSGCVRLNLVNQNVSRLLANEVVGVEPIDDGVWQLWFGPVYLGRATALGKGQLNFERNKPIQRNNNPKGDPSSSA